MSILTNPRPNAPMAPAIQAKINEAISRLRPLESSQGEIALDAALGVAGADGRLSKIQEQIAVEKATISKLRLAHTVGLARDQEAERAQRAALRKTQLAALRKHLEARDAAAAALGGAIAEAVKQFKILAERSKKGGDANPIGGDWPVGAVSELSQLQALVAQEIYRQDRGDVLLGNRRSFPGAAVIDLNHQGNPDAIEPLADHLKRNSAYIIDMITGRVS